MLARVCFAEFSGFIQKQLNCLYKFIQFDRFLSMLVDQLATNLCCYC